MTTRGSEIRAQAELIKYIGPDKIKRLSHDTMMQLFAEWRDIINDWEAHHDGEPPNAGQMAWVFGVWHNMPPKDYIEQLAQL
jgi:hypothetical protein